MPQKPAKKSAKPVVRKQKSPEEIKRELREQRALDPRRSETEDYISGTNRHFGL